MDQDMTLAEKMAEAARQLLDTDSRGETFQRAVELAHSGVQGCDGAGLSFVHARKQVETVGSTDEMVVTGDRLQYELSEGPCLDAIWEQAMIYSPSLAYDGRWPTWGPRVVEETAAQSILSFQLFTHEDTLGALNLYSRTKDGFDQAAIEEGTALAAHIAVAVAYTQEAHTLAQGLDSRTIIGQAIGILMERYDLDGDRAFSVLARMSSQGNVKLRTIASDIVAKRREARGHPL